MRKAYLFLFLFFGNILNAQLCFKPPINHLAMGEWSTISGDFNNDNFMDIACFKNYKDINILLGNGTGSLTLASTFSVSGRANTNYLSELVTRDFNNDGNLDIATICNFAAANRISLFLGTGTGSFVSTSVTNSVGTLPTSIISTDFNNDGKMDLAVTNNTSKNVSVLLGTGTGSFASAVNIPMTLGTPISISSGDFNSDGKIDLAVGIQTVTVSHKIAVFIGNGSGNFSAGTSFTVANSYPHTIEVMDFNLDGKSDIVCGKGNGGVVGVFLGTGTGVFSQENLYNTLGGYYTNIVCGDYNSDGITDIATGCNGTSEVCVLQGTGTGSFNTALKYPAGTHPMSITSADFNNDGKNDFAVGLDLSGGINVLLNGPLAVSLGGNLSICSGNSTTLTINGANTYTWSANAGSTNTSSVSITPTSTTVYSVVAVNGSCPSVPKFATVNVTTTPTVSLTQSSSNICRGSSLTFTATGGTTYSWSPNAGSSTSSVITLFPTSSTAYTVTGYNSQCFNTKVGYITVTNDLLLHGYTTYNLGSNGPLISKDFNNDGKIDILQGSELFLGDGKGSFNTSIQIPVSAGIYSETANDFNGDGYLDIAVAAGNLNVQVALSNGNNSYTGPITLNSGSLPTIIGSDDFNSDTYVDLAVGSGTNVFILTGNGSGGFNSAISYSLPVSSVNGMMCIGDFNNDTKKDIVISGQLLLGTGTGGFLAAQNAGSGTIVVSNDINNDGNLDLVSANGTQIDIRLGNGDGTFYHGPIYGTGASSGISSIICADLNNDGYTDFATTSLNYNNVFVTLGNGVGSGSSQSYPLFNTSGYIGITYGDYTGNGKNDLAAGAYGPAGFSVLLNGLDVYANEFTVCQGSYLMYNDTYGDGFTSVNIYSPFGGTPINLAPPTPVTFSVIGTYGTCNYQEIKTFTIPVKPSPALSVISSGSVICLTDPGLNSNQYQPQVLFTASGAVNYQFGSGISSATNTFAITNDPNQPFINNPLINHNQLLEIIGTNNYGCSVRDSIYLKVIPAFSVAVTSATSCSSPNCTLTAFSANAVDYLWNNGQHGSPILVQPQSSSPGTPQIYSVTAIDANGCGSVANASSTVQLLPNQLTNFSYITNSLSVTFSMTNTSFCSSAGFLWDFGNGMQNIVAPNPSVTYATPGLYTACLKCGNNVPQACIACKTFSLPSNTSGGTDVGIEEIVDASAGLRIYPIPSDGILFIETEKEYTIEITNLLGSHILSQKLYNGKNQISLSEQSNGLYFIKCQSSTFKIIKQ